MLWINNNKPINRIDRKLSKSIMLFNNKSIIIKELKVIIEMINMNKL